MIDFPTIIAAGAILGTGLFLAGCCLSVSVTSWQHWFDTPRRGMREIHLLLSFLLSGGGALLFLWIALTLVRSVA